MEQQPQPTPVAPQGITFDGSPADVQAYGDTVQTFVTQFLAQNGRGPVPLPAEDIQAFMITAQSGTALEYQQATDDVLGTIDDVTGSDLGTRLRDALTNQGLNALALPRVPPVYLAAELYALARTAFVSGTTATGAAPQSTINVPVATAQPPVPEGGRGSLREPGEQNIPPIVPQPQPERQPSPEPPIERTPKTVVTISTGMFNDIISFYGGKYKTIEGGAKRVNDINNELRDFYQGLLADGYDTRSDIVKLFAALIDQFSVLANDPGVFTQFEDYVRQARDSGALLVRPNANRPSPSNYKHGSIVDNVPSIGSELEDLEFAEQLARVLSEYTSTLNTPTVMSNAVAVATSHGRRQWVTYLEGMARNVAQPIQFSAYLSRIFGYLNRCFAETPSRGEGIAGCTEIVKLKEVGRKRDEPDNPERYTKYVMINYGTIPTAKRISFADLGNTALTGPEAYKYLRHLYKIPYFIDKNKLKEVLAFIEVYTKALFKVQKVMDRTVPRGYYIVFAVADPNATKPEFHWHDLKFHKMRLSRIIGNQLHYFTFGRSRDRAFTSPWRVFSGLTRTTQSAANRVRKLYRNILNWINSDQFAITPGQPLPSVQFFQAIATSIINGNREIGRVGITPDRYGQLMTALANFVGESISNTIVTPAQIGIINSTGFAALFKTTVLVDVGTRIAAKTEDSPQHFRPDELFVDNVLNFAPPTIKAQLQQSKKEGIVVNNSNLNVVTAINNLSTARLERQEKKRVKKARAGIRLTTDRLFQQNLNAIHNLVSIKRDDLELSNDIKAAVGVPVDPVIAANIFTLTNAAPETPTTTPGVTVGNLRELVLAQGRALSEITGRYTAEERSRRQVEASNKALQRNVEYDATSRRLVAEAEAARAATANVQTLG